MDPNETLKQIRALDEEGNSDEAMMLFHHLDDWMGRGGFLPQAWVSKDRLDAAAAAVLLIFNGSFDASINRATARRLARAALEGRP